METRICKRCGRELPIENFKVSRWGGRVEVCTECANQKRIDNKVKKQQEAELQKAKAESAAMNRRQILEQFKPRELMEELSRRSYKGKLTFTQVIDIYNF